MSHSYTVANIAKLVLSADSLSSNSPRRPGPPIAFVTLDSRLVFSALPECLVSLQCSCLKIESKYQERVYSTFVLNQKLAIDRKYPEVSCNNIHSIEVLYTPTFSKCVCMVRFPITKGDEPQPGASLEILKWPTSSYNPKPQATT